MPAAARRRAAVGAEGRDKHERSDVNARLLLLLLLLLAVKQRVPSARRLQQLLHHLAAAAPVHDSHHAAAAAAALVYRLHSVLARIHFDWRGSGAVLQHVT